VSERRITDKVAEACRQKLAALAHARRGIGILRGKHFGHKLLGTPISDVLRQAELKIRDVDEMLKTSFWLLGRLAFACRQRNYRGSGEYDRYAKENLEEVFKYFLDKFNSLGQAQ
jgi:hypothetical protein